MFLKDNFPNFIKENILVAFKKYFTFNNVLNFQKFLFKKYLNTENNNLSLHSV